MKISSKIPSIGIPDSSEVDPKQRQSNPKSEIASRVDKFEGPKSLVGNSVIDPGAYKDSHTGYRENSSPFPDWFGNPDAFDDGFLASPAATRQQTSESSPSSRTNSLTNHYKGPDSIQTSKIESPISKYEGPKSLVGKSVIDPRAYQDSHTGHSENNPSFPDTFGHPDAFRDFLTILGATRKQTSESSPDSRTNSTTNHYKGPDSVQVPEIESRVEKDKLPDSVELTDSKE
jgi:hypothetical protein